VFIALRKVFPDNSPIADWTRKWKCSWIVMIDKEKFGPFDKRTKAINFEKETLRRKHF